MIFVRRNVFEIPLIVNIDRITTNSISICPSSVFLAMKNKERMSNHA